MEKLIDIFKDSLIYLSLDSSDHVKSDFQKYITKLSSLDTIAVNAAQFSDLLDNCKDLNMNKEYSYSANPNPENRLQLLTIGLPELRIDRLVGVKISVAARPSFPSILSLFSCIKELMDRT